MEELMYPAYQKFYSALKCLEEFNVNNDFFDNISSLDTFFSEYRNVTFVLQKSLSHTTYIEDYKKISEGIWNKFFNDQRAKVIHEHPVEIFKIIEVTVYYPDQGTKIKVDTFTVECDKTLATILDELKELFNFIEMNEVFFSVKYHFIEKDSGFDLWKVVIPGLRTIEELLDAMYVKIGEHGSLCEQLRINIEKMKIMTVPNDLLMVDDYVYDKQELKFEKANIIQMAPGKSYETDRFPLDTFYKAPNVSPQFSAFKNFVMMNINIHSIDLMPTIMIVYKDNTFTIKSFHSNLKTTFYRKINETSEEITVGNVKEVYVMNSYTKVLINKKRFSKKTKKKKTHIHFLVFMMVDEELNEKEYVFDGKRLKDIQYLSFEFTHGEKKFLDVGINNMKPIVEAFQRLSKQSV